MQHNAGFSMTSGKLDNGKTTCSLASVYPSGFSVIKHLLEFVHLN